MFINGAGIDYTYATEFVMRAKIYRVIISHLLYTGTPTTSSLIHTLYFFVFSRMVFIISLPTFVASGNLFSKNFCVLRNRSL